MWVTTYRSAVLRSIQTLSFKSPSFFTSPRKNNVPLLPAGLKRWRQSRPAGCRPSAPLHAGLQDGFLGKEVKNAEVPTLGLREGFSTASQILSRTKGRKLKAAIDAFTSRSLLPESLKVRVERSFFSFLLGFILLTESARHVRQRPAVGVY